MSESMDQDLTERIATCIADIAAGRFTVTVEAIRHEPNPQMKHVLTALLNLERSVSVERRARRAVAKRMYQLARTNEDLELFAYTASHDLREPLRQIAALGAQLRERAAPMLDEHGGALLDRMTLAADHMQSLIDGILLLSRTNTGAQPFEEAPLYDVVTAAVSDLSEQLGATGGSVVIEQLPTVEVDRAQMTQLFHNVLVNALTFTRPDVAPQVRVKRRELVTEAGVCEIEIEDNGTGFHADDAERIFLPFERLVSGDEIAGSGMGLAICRRIARRHGGELSARSTPGRGSTFTVQLPTRQERPSR